MVADYLPDCKCKKCRRMLKDSSGSLRKASTLTSEGAIQLARQGFLVDVSIEEINDKSKSDVFSKSLVFMQILWLAVQCIARVTIQLPLTALEINTMLHAICSLWGNVAWFQKPQDIVEPMKIKVSSLQLVQNPAWVCCEVPNVLDYRYLEKPRRTMFWIRGPAFVVYGCFHFILWKEHFPTRVEQIIWRGCAGYISSMGIIILCWELLITYCRYPLTLPVRFWEVLTMVGRMALAFCSFILVVQGFVCIRSLPKGAYKTVNWVEIIPHL